MECHCLSTVAYPSSSFTCSRILNFQVSCNLDIFFPVSWFSFILCLSNTIEYVEMLYVYGCDCYT